jgi:hypothetical protein
VYDFFFRKIFHNDLKPSDIHPPFQTKVTQDLDLINGSNNIIVIIIRFVLGHMNNSRMETKHNTQTFLCDMWDSKVVVSSTLPFAWKVVILLEIKQTK